MMILVTPYFIVSDVEDETVDLGNFSKGCLSQELTKKISEICSNCITFLPSMFGDNG